MHVNNACMFYAPHASIVVWKSQIGAKTLVNLGAGKKLMCFDPLQKGYHDVV
jgi:urease accessory protein UreH